LVPRELRSFALDQLGLVDENKHEVALAQGCVDPGLNPEQRRAALAEIDGRIRAAEVDEERIVRELEARGLDVDRRGDADPSIVLGLEPAA